MNHLTRYLRPGLQCKGFHPLFPLKNAVDLCHCQTHFSIFCGVRKSSFSEIVLRLTTEIDAYRPHHQVQSCGFLEKYRQTPDHTSYVGCALDFMILVISLTYDSL